MAVHDNRQTVLDLLTALKGIDPLKELFWRELNYERANQAIPTGSWTDTERTALADDPLLFATAGQDGDFHVLYCRLHSEGKLHISDERVLINRLLNDHLYSLFVFSDAGQENWHFVNVRNDPDATKRRIFRRISVGPNERLRTACERISLLDVASMSPALHDLSALDIQQKHDEAFNVEAVTKQFFDDYKTVFNLLQEDLQAQIPDRTWAHDYALSLLNRLMFLYFVQRKRWLGDDTEFIRSYFDAYAGSGQPKDTFFEKWLKPLFFEAFNNKKSLLNTPQRRHIPEHFRKALCDAPYLNGGLFAENRLDAPGDPFTICDSRLERVIEFLDNYNFTIAEDSPLDQEVSVDPEMIGKVYESLVNVSEEADERGDAGIFYTPRTEIDLMCRLALVDNLSGRIGQQHRKLLYELIFALEPDEKKDADGQVSAAGLWNTILKELQETKIVDPACGSGSFLVGMLHIMDDVQERAQTALGIAEDSYERRKRIIGQNLYGVDVMEWACHVAELRLWLALIIDAQFTREELAFRHEPLLPNFTFNIRCGDSLVEEVGGIGLAHLTESTLSRSMKQRITKLTAEKAKFYYGDCDCEFHSVQDAQQAERSLFHDILEERIIAAQRELAAIGNEPKQVPPLIGGFDKPQQETLAESERWKKEREQKQAEINNLLAAQKELARMSGLPFVWSIAFAEVFRGNRSGFDIVVGNPPYVRQEQISDPRLPRDEVTAENKRRYKEKVMLTTQRDHPDFFQYKCGTGKAVRKIDAKSDLYIYFYFRGLHILNPTGSFVFITSNSWLDVGYGADLQEFLLRQCHLKLVMDNQVKRSFASADVNSVICLLSAPSKKKDAGLSNIARFVMFKVPFEQVLSAVVFEEIEEAEGRRSTPEYRVQVVKQKELLERGFDQPAEDEEDEPANAAPDRRFPLVKVPRYVGDKWGGKYLRAPDIYWTILEKGKGKLVRLGDIAEVRFGIKTGCNEFFYLDEEKIRQWGIEEEFLKPVIKSPRECRSLEVSPRDLGQCLFVCHLEKRELAGTRALEYIRWGETQGFHKGPSCAGRRRWWECRETPGNTFWAKELRDRIGVFGSAELLIADCRFYVSITDPVMQALLNSALSILCDEVGARNYGGGGGPRSVMVYEVQNQIILSPRCLASREREALQEAFTVVARRPLMSINKEMVNDDRRALDNVLFDAIGLTQCERDAVYEAVVELVTKRLSKAESV
ncbi:MAG: hypothetical protein KatS3mg024_1547 [Armatimonadota bacterium]|nr:MAG: hypothetical protein KatS3mg024_1547 [Armatimonadota bacterium]